MRRSNGPMSMRAITKGGPSSNLDDDKGNEEDDGPTVVQDYQTRREIKSNEEEIRKGKLRTWISIGIVLLTLVLTIAVWSWYTSLVHRYMKNYLCKIISFYTVSTFTKLYY